MTPQERELITSLFERMRGFGAPAKDREAETSHQPFCRCQFRYTVHACANDADPRAGA